MISSPITILLFVMTVTMSSKVPDPLGNDVKHPLPQHPNDPPGKKVEKTGDIRRRDVITDEYDESPSFVNIEILDDSGSQKQSPVNPEESVVSTNEESPNQNRTSENVSFESGVGASSRAEFNALFEQIARISDLAGFMPPGNFYSTRHIYAYIIGLHEDFLQKLQVSNTTQWHKYPEYDEFQQVLKKVHQRVDGLRKALQSRRFE